MTCLVKLKTGLNIFSFVIAVILIHIVGAFGYEFQDTRASVPWEQQLQVDILTSSIYHCYQSRRAGSDLINPLVLLIAQRLKDKGIWQLQPAGVPF